MNVIKIINVAGIQAVSLIIAFVTNIYLARELGQIGFGYYGLFLSLITLGLIPISAGVSQVVVRFLSNVKKTSNDKVKVVINALILSFITSTVMMLIYYYAYDYGLILTMMMFVIMFSRASVTIFGSVLNAQKRFIMSQVFSLMLIPLLLILFLLKSDFFNESKLTYEDVIYYQLISSLIVVLVSVLYFLFKRDVSFKYNFQLKDLVVFTTLGPVILIGLVNTLTNELAVVAISIFSSIEDVSNLKISFQVISALGFILSSVNIMLAPGLSNDISVNNLDSCQSNITRATRISSFLSIPILIFVVFFSDQLILIGFGEEYNNSSTIIKILCIGQLVNITMGSVGVISNMLGIETKLAKVAGKVMLCYVILLLILTYFWGSLGAAYAVALSMVSWNVYAAIEIKKETGFITWLR
ncbi:hypothetical protein BCT41_14070 [Vibrio splendidus]|uniref:oligosaccharide flippase family protein n=1 Tax=Vibrio splendidus TaxID=29497 RepID=UPI000CB08301|nr:oligosaccharide flippase family protein [Vibrio splendidus]PMM20007.1 hypothetical protein BCT62_00675 [Vibrio splendidus]PMM98509.1 hypothetical protein BCT41_14070 [Vibrio splendidus]PMN33094.1 hypothetical protein BCT36_05910 [Vibrio splendidus]